MTYKILSSRQFENDFNKLDKSFQTRVRKKMKQVAENPERYKHMHYDFSGSSRIRIDKLRILFSHNKEKKIIYLEKIVFGHNY